MMTSQTGIIRSFNPHNNIGLITCDLGGDIQFHATQVSKQQKPVSGNMVEFVMDDSSSKLQAVKIRFI